MCTRMDISGIPGYDPETFHYVPDLVTFQSVDGTGSDVKSVTLPGINEPGLDHVFVASIDQDRGVVSTGSASYLKAQVRFTAKQQTWLGGGSFWHSYATRPTYQQNDMPFGARLRPGEDALVEFKNNAAGTIEVKIVRYRAFRRPGR